MTGSDGLSLKVPLILVILKFISGLSFMLS